MDSLGHARSSNVARDAGGASSRVAVPLVRTKLVMPAPGSSYGERARLDAILDRGLDDNVRLLLLSAPPGYGKTMALAGWLESRGLARAWLSLDPADNDLARFARYLVAAIRTVRPGTGDATADLFGPGAAPDAARSYGLTTHRSMGVWSALGATPRQGPVKTRGIHSDTGPRP
jgi:hypothetical protein